MDKWFVMFIAVFCIAMFSPLVMKEHSDSNCRIEAMKSGVPPEKVAVACGLSK